MKKKYLIFAIAITIIFSMAGVGTMAWFSSQAISSDNNFTTGTLKLGGKFPDGYIDYVFDNLSIGDIRPGLPAHENETIIKNTGTLPFKLYRINALNFHQNNYIPLYDELTFDVYIIENYDNPTVNDIHHVYTGSLYDLRVENGGYFENIQPIYPGDEMKLKLVVTMNDNAGNEFQGKKVGCDLELYAAQLEMPLPGDSGGREFMTRGYERDDRDPQDRYFSVFGQNYYDSNGELEKVAFDYDWTPFDPEPIVKDWYEIRIKHHTGYSNREIVIRTFVNGTIKIVSGDVPVPNNLYNYVFVYPDIDRVEILDEFFDSLGWASEAEMYEVQFYGKLHHGNWNFETPYTRWVF